MTGTAPTTTNVRVGWRQHLDLRSRFRRVGDSGMAIVQIVIAATAAYAFCVFAFGHPAPLLAATVTLTSLGLVRDARPRRVAESVVGMLLGIAVAEVIYLVVGSGWWQLGVALFVSMIAARFFSMQPSFAIAAGIQAIIVMVLPSGAPFVKLLDGIVGGVAALLVTAFIPRNPTRMEKRDGQALIVRMSSAGTSLVQALRRGDRLRAERGLEKARAAQPAVDNWRVSLESGIGIARISPFLRRQRSELQRHERIRQSLDFASRNLRVVARRIVYLCDDGVPRPISADVLSELMRGLDLVGAALHDRDLEPVAREAIAAVAIRLDPRELLPGGSLGDHGLIGALRPLTVDLLTASGMTAADARALMPRL